MNIGKQALAILNAVAPTLATALGGPAAGMAVKALQAHFGTASDDATEAAILNATPEQLGALKKVDNDFKVQMAQIGFDEDKLRFDDTASARAREVAVKDWMPRILATTVVGLVILAEGAMLYFGQPKNVDGVVLGRILGTLDAALMLVLGYYFGSSAGSAAKDKTLADLAKQP